jgi:hypothetical protein
VHADRLRVRLRPRRRGAENLVFLHQIRGCYPQRLRIYWIQDNLSANWTPEIRAYAASHNVELIPTPTYASYLNPIECQFVPISEFVVKERRLPRLDGLRARARTPRHIPQLTPPRPAADRP